MNSPRPVLLAAALAVAACQSKAAPPPAPAEPTIEQKEAQGRRASEHRWQRMKDCAEQAERTAKREKLFAGAVMDPYLSMGYTNHYSPKYERCFIDTSMINNAPKKNPGMPLTERILFDAYEGRLLATCSSTDGNFVICQFDGDDSAKGDCGRCAAFIEDRMTN
jgi:hypothetical protein